MARRRKQGSSSIYSVWVRSYASQEVKERVERGEEVPVDQLYIIENKYFNLSPAWAGEAFVRTLKRARKDPLALVVTLRQESELLAEVKVKE